MLVGKLNYLNVIGPNIAFAFTMGTRFLNSPFRCNVMQIFGFSSMLSDSIAKA